MYFDGLELEGFRSIVGKRLRLQFDNGKMEFLADVLRQRLDSRGMSTAAYLACLESRDAREELGALASCLTVTETYFFRTPEHFRALLRVALPERIRDARPKRRLRLLSAGCASGEEPYSLAIVLREHFPEIAGWDLRIVGMDMNPLVLEKARKARYSEWSFRQTPAEIRDKYFTRGVKGFALDKSVCSVVSFEERNLALQNHGLGSAETYDIIFCCNVIMYLVPEAIQLAVEQLTKALAPAGFLFLGHAETLRGWSQAFHLRHTDDTFYYQKRVESEAPIPCAPRRYEIREPAIPEITDMAWGDAIRMASERIDTLSTRSGAPSGSMPLGLPARSASRGGQPADLGRAIELLRQEKYREALGGLPQGPAAHHETQLLRAVLLTNCGELKEAEAICRQLLSIDDLNTGAHYLAALCRESAGDFCAAMEHDRAAIYLDPAFAMPHLHLGLLAKRSGDVSTARRELQRAGELLPREDGFRILLLGGGFSREAMLEFSRAQLRACGGAL